MERPKPVMKHDTRTSLFKCGGQQFRKFNRLH